MCYLNPNYTYTFLSITYIKHTEESKNIKCVKCKFKKTTQRPFVVSIANTAYPARIINNTD